MGPFLARRKNLVLLLFLLAALALRLFNLGEPGITIDEAWDIRVMKLSAAEILAKLAHPPRGTFWGPPLNYLLLAPLVSAGGDPLLCERTVSVLWSVLALALVGFALRDRFPFSAIIIVLLLLALHPFQQYWGRQARWYPLLQFLSVATWILFIRFAERPTGFAAGLLVVTAIAGAYTHYHYLLVWVSLLAVLPFLGARSEPRRFRFLLLIANLLLLLALLPWAPVILAKVTDRSAVGAMTISSAAPLLRAGANLLAGYPLPRSAWSLLARYGAVAGYLVLFGCALPGYRGRGWLLLPVAVPFGIAVAAGLVSPSFSDRFLIIIHIPLYLLLLPGLAGLWTRRLAVAAAAWTLLCFAYVTATITLFEPPGAEGYRQAAAIIARDYDPDRDTILCVAPFAQTAIEYYLPAADGYRYVAPDQPRREPGTRLWLVWSHWAVHDRDGTILQGLRDTAPLDGQWQVRQTGLYRFRME